jgi:outer membrane protein assembly factor BamB
MSHLVFDDQEENLFVSTLSGTLHKIDTSTGREQWAARTGGYCHSTPAIADGVVVVGSADASVHAFSESGGTPLWKFETAGPVYGGPTIVKDTVAIASGDGRVYGLDLKSGSKKWEFELPASNTAFAQSRACTDGKLVFVGAWDWHTYGIDAETGKQVWRTICCERSFAYSPAIGSPAYAFGAVYVPANGNRLWKLNAATGEVIWSVSSEGDKFGHSSPRVEGARVYVAGLGERGKLMCLDAVSGKELWAGYTGSTIYDSSPAIGEDYVVIGSVGSLLSAFDKSSGAHLGSYRLRDGHFLASPAVKGKRVFAATFNDRITALKLER